MSEPDRGLILEFAADCRRNPDLASCAILACTAGQSLEEERRAMDVGCDAYVTKPVNVHELPELLRSLLRSPRDGRRTDQAGGACMRA